MAVLQITVDNAIAGRVLDAISALHGYQDTVDIGTTFDPEGNHIPEIVPNPESKQEFVRKYIITLIKNQVVTYEGQIAAEDARDVAEEDAQTDIILT